MRFKNRKFTKASFAFLCFACLCGFFNYITLSFLHASGSSGASGGWWQFAVYFFQVAAALATIYYGERLLSARKDDKEWFYTALKTPDELSRQKETKVIFITVDGCLFNGRYSSDDRIFYGYDGLDFPLEEVGMWTIQKVSLALDECNHLDEEES